MATRPERILIVWQVLIAKATNRQTINYLALADAIGLKHGAHRSLRNYLDPIANHCCAMSLPVLTVVVVSLQTGRPSEVPNGLDADEEREAELQPPDVGSVRRALDLAWAEGHDLFPVMQAL